MIGKALNKHAQDWTRIKLYHTYFCKREGQGGLTHLNVMHKKKSQCHLFQMLTHLGYFMLCFLIALTSHRQEKKYFWNEYNEIQGSCEINVF